jgi:hypothetical protein
MTAQNKKSGTIAILLILTLAGFKTGTIQRGFISAAGGAEVGLNRFLAGCLESGNLQTRLAAAEQLHRARSQQERSEATLRESEDGKLDLFQRMVRRLHPLPQQPEFFHAVKDFSAGPPQSDISSTLPLLPPSAGLFDR